MGNYLFGRLGMVKQNPDELRKVVALLKAERFKGSMAQSMAARFDPDRALAPGKTLPGFEFGALKGDKVDGKKPLRSKSFEGSVTLIDVWATWCKPCLAELPRLHEIYAKYSKARKGKKALKMVSISLDEKPETVAKFRADREHAMPWAAGFAGANSEIVKQWTGSTSTAIPLYVLVDAKGKILASSPDITAEKLPELLDKALQ